jgi:hypothetical protein
MLRGSRGNLGIPGLLLSVGYGQHLRRKASNLTLTASLYSLQGHETMLITEGGAIRVTTISW